MFFFEKIAQFFREKVSNKNKPDINTVTFDDEGNIVNHPSSNPSHGTPEEIKKLAKELVEKVQKIGK